MLLGCFARLVADPAAKAAHLRLRDSRRARPQQSLGCGVRSRLRGIPLQVAFGNARSLSKVPFVIAIDQGIFERYGLNVSLWLPPADGESEIPASQVNRPAPS